MKHSLSEYEDLKNADEKETVIRILEDKNEYGRKSH